VFTFGVVYIRINMTDGSSANTGSLLLPVLFTIPMTGCFLLISQSVGRLNRGMDHLPLLIASALVTVPVWIDNAQTAWLWYQAGSVERSWTPFKYDRPKEIQEAEKKPYLAANLYHQVEQRLRTKGSIPKRLNWPFFMRYRMAVQAMRKSDAVSCVRFLHPSQVVHPKKIELLKDLWHLEFLWGMQSGEPDFTQQDRIFVDLAMNAARTTPYVLDRWGRVYSLINGALWLEWEPKESFNDAVKLARVNDAFAVLRANGNMIISKPVSLFTAVPPPLPPGHSWISLEVFRDSRAALLVGNHGEWFLFGSPPAGFPTQPRFRFDRPVVADVKLDPDEKGYYLLDVFGAIHSDHPNGPPSIPVTSPPVPSELLPYWVGIPMAVNLVIDPLGRGMCVYTREGEIYTVAVHPFRETYRPKKKYRYRGVALKVFADGTPAALESNGKLVTVP